MDPRRLECSARSAGQLVASLGHALIGAGHPPSPNPEPRGLTVRGDTARARGAPAANVFHRSESVVFRAEAEIDGRPDPEAIVEVQVVHGPCLPLAFHPGAGAGTPHFSSPPWPLALSRPTGRVHYTLTATDPGTGAVASWSPFPGPRSVLTIVPYPYRVRVDATPIGHAVRVRATVVRTVRRDGRRPALLPMAAGGVTAAIGFDGALTPSGELAALRSVRLVYADGAWAGMIGTSGLGPGLYVVQVRAQDLVTTPNVGTGNSPPFSIARGA